MRKRLKELINKRYVEERNAYGEAIYKKHLEFKKDAFETLGIENNPKREKLFEIAWIKGNDYGYSDVFGLMNDFLPLIED